jgi:hypothetical protein
MKMNMKMNEVKDFSVMTLFINSKGIEGDEKIYFKIYDYAITELPYRLWFRTIEGRRYYIPMENINLYFICEGDQND